MSELHEGDKIVTRAVGPEWSPWCSIVTHVSTGMLANEPSLDHYYDVMDHIGRIYTIGGMASSLISRKQRRRT